MAVLVYIIYSYVATVLHADTCFLNQVPSKMYETVLIMAGFTGSHRFAGLVTG